MTPEQALREAARRAAARTQYMPHNPHPKQRRFLELDHVRDVLAGGAAGGGKSDMLLMGALKYVHVPYYSAVLIRRTYKDLSDAGGLLHRAREWLEGTDAHWTGDTKTWRFPTGSQVSFGHMDDPRAHLKYKSSEFQYVGIDQAEQFPEAQVVYLFSRTRRKEHIDVPLRFRLSANPGDIGHDWLQRRYGIPDEIDFSRLYRTVAKDRRGKEQERVFLPARLEDNPSLGEDYEDMLAQLDEVTYQQLRHGHWVRDTSGLVYKDFLEARNTTTTLPLLPEGEDWIYVLSCDFGVTDPTAYVVLAFSAHDPNVYIVRSEEWTDLAPSDACDIANEWNKLYGFERIVGDIGGLGKGFEREWRKRYTPMHAAQKTDKLGYIKLMNGDLRAGRLQIVDGANDKLVADLRALCWEDKEAPDQLKKEHPALDNHLPDALLYGWREARHWAWEERERKPATPEEEARAYSAERKRKLAERNRRNQDADNDDWILGP